MAKAPILATAPDGSVVELAARSDSDGRRQQTVSLGSDSGAAVADILELTDRLLRAIQTQPPRALQYARDTADRMRVSVDNSPNALVLSQNWLNNNAWAAWYSTGAPTAMDAREQHRELSLQTFQAQRSRWTIT